MKKLIKKYWKIMVVIVILGIFVLLFFLVRYIGKKNLEANIAAEQQDVFEEMASLQKRYRKYFMHWRGQRRGNVGT